MRFRKKDVCILYRYKYIYIFFFGGGGSQRHPTSSTFNQNSKSCIMQLNLLSKLPPNQPKIIFFLKNSLLIFKNNFILIDSVVLNKIVDQR